MKKILISLLFPLSLLADTTGNLLTNGTFDNGTTGWTLSGDAQRISDCCPGGHDLEFGDSGSIEQSFDLYSETITQPMLNNGITLNSSVQVQNGECGVSGCWGGSGPADTFTIRLQIRDSDSNVLATTTQERTNVTGINGEDFTDTVSYTGTGSNIGNIFISGTDGNSPATLGGPNLDNISVTMTYDPTLLSAQETANIATAFEEIEEVLTTVSPEELFIYQEFIVEEFIPFEEPQILVEMLEEITFEEIAIEEINTGIVEIFTVAIEEEIIPMEVSYEEPQTIEAFTTEVESFEEAVETTENINYETEAPGEEVSTGGGNEETNTNVAEEETTNIEGGSKETIVAEKQGGTEGVSSEEVTRTNEEESASEDAASSEDTIDERTSDSESGSVGEENDRSTEVMVGNSSGETTPDVSIETIREQVSRTVLSVDQQMIGVQTIVAQAMQNNTILEAYTQRVYTVPNELLIKDRSLNDYISKNYIDSRNIYSDQKNYGDDELVSFQAKIQETMDEVIRTEEHLRRIRGY